MKQPRRRFTTRSQLLLLLSCLAAGSLPSTSVHAAASSSAAETKNYIDTIAGYDELSTCAERVLSTIVRNENSGCQDTYALTSYTCFCTDSSAYFSSVISRDVTNGCASSSGAAAQAESALAVFSSYCDLGVAAGLAATQVDSSSSTATSSGAAEAAGSASAATATSTATSSSSSSSSAEQDDQSSGGTGSSSYQAIIVGIAVAAGGIILVLSAVLFWVVRRTKAARALHVLKEEPSPGSSSARVGVQELPWKGSAGRAAEAPAVERPVEAPARENPVEVSGGLDRVLYELPGRQS